MGQNLLGNRFSAKGVVHGQIGQVKLMIVNLIAGITGHLAFTLGDQRSAVNIVHMVFEFIIRPGIGKNGVLYLAHAFQVG